MMTADDKLIVNHDRIYKGTEIDMEKGTLKEITSIVLPNGENIPTLDAYLRLVAAKPDTRLVLEMKSLSDLRREDLAAEKIVKALRKYDLLDRTYIIAFFVQCLPGIQETAARRAYLLPERRPLPAQHQGARPHRHRLLDVVLRKHPEWVEQAKKLGLEVNVWTVDEEEDMRYFIDLGVDYITTDYPERLQALLK